MPGKDQNGSAGQNFLQKTNLAFGKKEVIQTPLIPGEMTGIANILFHNS